MIAETSEFAFSYRPKTCFGIGQCTLADAAAEKTVLKRGRSCGAADVIITDRSDREKLRCIVPGKAEDRTTVPGGPLWLHQEYIETLQTLGEFRVFIRSQSPSGAIYSHCGEVICSSARIPRIPGNPASLLRLQTPGPHLTAPMMLLSLCIRPWMETVYWSRSIRRARPGAASTATSPAISSSLSMYPAQWVATPQYPAAGVKTTAFPCSI